MTKLKQLPPCTVTISRNALRHAHRIESSIPGLVAECNSVRAQRDELREVIQRAVAELRAGRPDSALAILDDIHDAS